MNPVIQLELEKQREQRKRDFEDNSLKSAIRYLSNEFVKDKNKNK